MVGEKGERKRGRRCVRTCDELQEEHERVCSQVTGEVFAPAEKLPNPGNNTLQFKKWSHLFPSPMRCYADFESALVGCHEVMGEKTVSYEKHVPIAFPFKTCLDIPGLQFRPVDYRGEDAAKVFVKMIRQLARKIQERFPGPVKARRTSEEEKEWEKETKCFACGGEFVPSDKKLIKVFDHCHYSGKYRSAMHSVCNFQCKDRRTFPIFFHNFSGYDSHLIIKELNAFDDGEISLLNRNEEKCISVKKSFHTANITNCWGHPVKEFVHFEFKDSFLFMSSSLEVLSKSLVEEDFTSLRERFGENRKLLTGKFLSVILSVLSRFACLSLE